MNAQTRTEIVEPPIWTGWQNAVINGVYPLRRLLHGSEHGAVFLTERKGQAVADAALKIVPVERVTLSQLSYWRQVSRLFHPHLLQLFDAGLCHLGGRQFLFVVMEYAQETLSGVLAHRALTEQEGRELLPPSLAALSFLHQRGFVLSHLKPANVLVVDDQLKLASDGIRPIGAPRVDGLETSAYEAPEADHAPFSAADDIWGLGVTLVEALSRQFPLLERGSVGVVLSDAVPAALADMLLQCLERDPSVRPSAADLQAWVAGTGTAPANLPVPEVALPQAVAAENLVPAAMADPIVIATNTQATPAANQSRRMFAIAAAIVSGLAIVGWAGLQGLHSRPTVQAAPVVLPPVSAPQTISAPPVAAQRAATPALRPAVIRQPLPDVSRSSLRTISGRVKVLVVAIVDPAGAVVETRLKEAGPSAYFATRARDAAKKWRFTPTDRPGTREWTLRFEFTRGGIISSAAARS